MNQGPVIFAANHPSAFMDPMVVATIISRPLNFLVAAEFFKGKLKSWLYQNHFNMIPVYRPTTLPGEAYKNDGVFTRVIELLSAGGAILVFPEGNSVTEKRIRKLKTGIARMALGTKQATGKSVLKIIPIGLNYANPHRFRSDLLINIGKPISIEQFLLTKADVVTLTDEVEKGLKETVLHIQKEELDSVVKKVELILKRRFGDTTQQKAEEFALQQRVIESIQSLIEKKPEIISGLETRLDQYLNKIRQLGISDGAIANLSFLVSITELTRLIITFPVFLTGYAINAGPYYATVYYFRSLNLFQREGYRAPRANVRPAFFGSIAMAIGMVMFLVYYLVLFAISIWFIGNIWWSVGFLIAFYFSGLFTMRYIRWFYLFTQKWKLRKLIEERKDVFTSLIVERQEIIRDLTVITN